MALTSSTQKVQKIPFYILDNLVCDKIRHFQKYPMNNSVDFSRKMHLFLFKLELNMHDVCIIRFSGKYLDLFIYPI